MQRELTVKLLYPNPMKPTGIEFELPEAATVTLEVFDESGKSVLTVFNQIPMSPGKHLLEYNKFELSDGEYILRMITTIHGEEKRMTKKILIEGVSE